MSTISADGLQKAKGPKYKRVSDTIRGAINNGSLKTGTKLPPVRELAYQLGITPGTVARAYSILTTEGVLVAEVGRGTFVATPNDLPLGGADLSIEIDVVPHNAPPPANGEISLYSPHLPNVGQSALLRQLLAQISQNPPSGLMHYPSQASGLPARKAVIEWLRGLPLGSISEHQVVLTNGGQNAVSLLFQTLLRGQRPAVLVEELSYPGFRRAAHLLRADVIPVAMDEHGVIPEALEAAARSHDAQIFCTTPDVHNPTGISTPEYRREALATVARRHDLQIVEDACYMIRGNRARSYRMICPERAWYITSLSKSITPALRFGFVIGPDDRAIQLRRSAEYGFFGVSTIILDLVTALLTHPKLPAMEKELARTNNQYLQAAVNVLGGYPIGWHPEAPYLWLHLPDGWRAGAFCLAAEANGVRIRPSEDYAARNGISPHAVRMAVNAAVPIAQFEEAMMRLRQLLDNPTADIAV